LKKAQFIWVFFHNASQTTSTETTPVMYSLIKNLTIILKKKNITQLQRGFIIMTCYNDLTIFSEWWL